MPVPVFPFIPNRADPWIVRYGSDFYFTATDDRLGHSVESKELFIRVGRTLPELAAATDVVIATARSTGVAGSFWAPELHVINGRLHLFVAASIGRTHWTAVQAHVMTLRAGGDPLNASHWQPLRRVLDSAGRALRRTTGRPAISLDMTVAQVGQQTWAIWSQRDLDPIGDAELWIAPLDPRDPARLAGTASCILKPELPWERRGAPVLEGPAIHIRNETVHLFYAASSTGPDYAVGLATTSVTSDPSVPTSWIKRPQPVLRSDPARGWWGPGHGCVFADADGTEWFVCHARPSPESPARHVVLAGLGWSATNTPLFG